MQRTLILLALLSGLCLTSCLATQGALNEANQTSARLESAVRELQAAQADGTATQLELEQLYDRVQRLGKQAAQQWKQLPTAAKADLDSIKDSLGGVLGLGAIGDATGIAGLLSAASWFLRDRRKRRGLDPLQNPTIPTPPTNAGGWAPPTWTGPTAPGPTA